MNAGREQWTQKNSSRNIHQSLSEEDKRRIEAEEEYRAQVRSRFQEEHLSRKFPAPTPTKKKGSDTFLFGCLTVAIVFFLLLFIGEISDTDSSSSVDTSSSSSDIDLNAHVWFQDGKVKVRNQDGFDWSNVKITLNGKMFNSGYFYEQPSVESGGWIEAKPFEFADEDGMRFNLLNQNILTIWVSADTPRGRGYSSFTVE